MALADADLVGQVSRHLRLRHPPPPETAVVIEQDESLQRAVQDGLGFWPTIRLLMVTQCAKKETLELKQQLLFNFAVTKQLRTFIPDTVHQRRSGMDQQEAVCSWLQ
jgi:hypothetical protein